MIEKEKKNEMGGKKQGGRQEAGGGRAGVGRFRINLIEMYIRMVKQTM